MNDTSVARHSSFDIERSSLRIAASNAFYTVFVVSASVNSSGVNCVLGGDGQDRLIEGRYTRMQVLEPGEKVTPER